MGIKHQLKELAAQLLLIAEGLPDELETTPVNTERPVMQNFPRRVPYDEFRSMLPRNLLAMVYELNYHHRREGRQVPEVSESLVQGPWRRSGVVPSNVVAYVERHMDTLVKMAKRPRFRWSPRSEARMVQLVMSRVGFPEAAMALSFETNSIVSVGSLKGRLYTHLPARPASYLQRHFSHEQIAFIQRR